MRVLVTGGNGFIGRHTCRELLLQDHTVTVLDTRGRTPVDGCDIHRGDIRDTTAVSDATAHADAVIHLAGVLGTQETITNPYPAAETNILGGLNVLAAARQYDLPLVNIGVGNWFENNTYSITKNTLERLAAMSASCIGQRVATVRSVNAYGPGQSISAPYGPSKVRKITPSFIARALHSHPIQIYGDGNQTMDMVHVSDVARTLVAALHHVIDHGGTTHVYECGTGRDITVNEIGDIVLKAVESLYPTIPRSMVEHLPMRPGETPGVIVRADPRTLTSLAPYGIDPGNLITLEDGMPETVVYFHDLLLGDR